MTADDVRSICLRGAREHNLAGVDLDLPLGAWIAVTGPSGSGKTSLVFDTLVREGERRFLGSLSARARHFFGKLGRSDVDLLTGLPTTIAVGQSVAPPNPRSTVGTLTGILDLLRLVFARAAVAPDSTPLSRSHFSFNHPVGQCEACRGLGVEDRVDHAKIVADPERTLRTGALVPTLKNGYTVYSQVTLEVMDQICRAHGFDVDTPWKTLTDEQRDVILFGTRALKVPFGKHSIESRMKWAGITARPREEGYYLGLVPVMTEALKRNRNENILRFVSSAECSACAGTRLGAPGREARLSDLTLPAILATPAAELTQTLQRVPDSEVWRRIRPSIDERVERIIRLGLGHLALDRPSASLSGGEAQRVRLAAQLGAGLCGVLFALDEPTLGLHPESQEGMREVLDELVERGNSLIVVEHDPDMVRHADHVVALGPGAGIEGGAVVATDLPDHPISTARVADPLGGPVSPKSGRRIGTGALTLTGVIHNNLDRADLTLTLGGLNVIAGPSGAGKSSLVFGTLLPALEGRPDGGAFEALTFPPGVSRSSTQAVDARPIGKTPRSTPATWSGLFDLIRQRFARLPAAKERGFTASHFSFNNNRGRCAECNGLGVTRLGLHVFEDVDLPCTACGGKRFQDQILAVELDGKSTADVLALSFREAEAFFAGDEQPAAICRAMVDLGLGYLTLGQSSGSLSRGESQRIKLGTLLGSTQQDRTIVLLDEPDRGLSPQDVAALMTALDKLVDAGHTVVAISHHRQVWAAADLLIEVREGRVDHEPKICWEAISQRRAPRAVVDARSRPIALRGVRTQNLRDIDVEFPRGKLTVVCGVSGSGKSSLVFATLAAEAQLRFAESLPFQVRRFLRRMPAPKLSGASGLTPTLDLRQGLGSISARSTISTQSECGPLLRLLFSRAGRVIREGDGAPCGLSASHFSRERALGACPECSGRGVQRRCDLALLITDPERPLPGLGAMSGSRVGRFLTEADGQHMATLASVLQARGLGSVDLATTPWNELAPEVQELALSGAGLEEFDVQWEFSSKAEGRGRHTFRAAWIGLCLLVEREAQSRARSKRAAEWAAALGDQPCTACEGTGLIEAARETRVLGHTLAELERLPLGEVLPALRGGLASEGSGPARAALDALLPELAERIDELVALGLSHLTLGRAASSLSTGELQRVRLASVLRSGLSGVTLVLDEPTVGLHEQDVLALLARLRVFQGDGNTVIVVSHRRSVLRAADHLIELGPGAGEDGGMLIAAGPPAVVLAGRSVTAQALAKDARVVERTAAAAALRVRGARVGNLGGRDFTFPASGFVCVTGVSGSGKTSLAFGVLAASVAAGRPVGCEAVDIPGGFERFTAVHVSSDHDARAARRTGSVLTALDLVSEVAALFSDPTLPGRAFKVGDAAGRCPQCRGVGRERVSLDFLADLDLPCQACDGTRFRPDILAVQFRGRNIAQWLDQPATTLLRELVGLDRGDRTKLHAKLCAALETLVDVAAGHLALGRPLSELSGGESARVALAATLRHSASPALYVFDEPSQGLHETDLEKVVAVFRRLGDRGDLVVATEHRDTVIAAADAIVVCESLRR